MSKLIDIQRELVVIKGQFNTYGNYAYRSSEDILTALKPLLIKHGCVLTVSDKIHALNEYIYIEATATLKSDSDTFTASSFARDGIVQKGMNSAQVTNSASSFAKKQALSNLFLIDDSAEVPPTAEEQIKIETEAKKQKEESEKANQERIDLFLNESKKNMDAAQTIEELKPIFGMVYRDAKKYGKKIMDDMEKYYNSKKEAFK